jgi:cholesterol transport system auxiliary component
MSAPSPISRRVLGATAALALAGCAGLFVSPPPKYIFRLTPVATFPPDLPRLRAQLRIDVPTAPAALDRQRIALTRSAISLDYFADAEWADTLSALVQTVLADSFENSRAIAVVDGSLGLRADFVLGTELRHFEAQYGAGGGPPAALVEIGAKLAKIPQSEVVAAARFERQVPAAGNDLPNIVTAFDRAQQAVTAEIVAWTLRNAAGRRTGRRL